MFDADHSPITTKKQFFVSVIIGFLSGILPFAFSFLEAFNIISVPIAWQIGIASGLGVLALVAAYLHLASRRRRKARAGKLLLVLGQSTVDSLLWSIGLSLLSLAVLVSLFYFGKFLYWFLFWPIVQLGMIPYIVIQERDPFEAREAGIWYAGELTCWDNIGPYRWDNSVLVITLKRSRSLASRWKIRVADREAAGQVLDRYLPAGQQQE